MVRKVVLATCSLNQWALDFEHNYKNILQSIIIAKQRGAKYRLGPELEISGFGCESHFSEKDTVLHSFQVLASLLQSPETTDIICDVGMPVCHKNFTYNCRVIFLNKKILLLRPKQVLATTGREHYAFKAWDKQRELEDFHLPAMIREITGQETVPIGDAVLCTLDTCFGCEMGSEVFSPISASAAMYHDGVEIVTNGSSSHFTFKNTHTRVNAMTMSTAKSGGVYMYSNLLGCDGDSVYYDGCSGIACNGDVVVQGSQFCLKEVEVLTAVVDLDDVIAYKSTIDGGLKQFGTERSYPRVKVDFEVCSVNPYLDTSLPLTWSYHTPEQEISLGPACWLWDYLRRSGGNGFFLPLSGGLDSASVACIVSNMAWLVCDAVKFGDKKALEDVRRIVADDSYTPSDHRELTSRLLVTCYLGTSNSSSETRQRASEVAADIGSHHLEVNVQPAVSAFLSILPTIQPAPSKFSIADGTLNQSLALQNVQARTRMVMSYLLAQLSLSKGYLLMLGTANADESLVGYCTKYDCSSSDINPIGGFSKDDLRRFILYTVDKFNYHSLKKVHSAPPSAELKPLVEGKAVQTDEEDLGMTYEELALFGRLMFINRCGPYSMFTKLVSYWKNKYTPQEIAQKVKSFFRRYAVNRHKSTIFTPHLHTSFLTKIDHRPFLYNGDWPWQFSHIDQQVKVLPAIKEGDQDPLD